MKYRRAIESLIRAGIFEDEDEPICPLCQEPLLEEDYPEFETEECEECDDCPTYNVLIKCPICGENLN